MSSQSLVGEHREVLSPKLILGNVGAGKTLLMATLGMEEAAKCLVCGVSIKTLADHTPVDGHNFQGRKVYANFDLSDEFKTKFPDVYSNWYYIESLIQLFRDRILIAGVTPYKSYQDLLLIDESWEVWESRESNDRTVTLMTRLIFLSRKLGFELIMSAQLSSSLDKRARFLSEMWILAVRLVNKDGSPYFKYHRWKVHSVNGTLIKLNPYILPNALYEEVKDYYNTTKPTSSEFETMVAELNALLGSDYEEQAVIKKHDDEYVDRFLIFGTIARNPTKRFTTQQLRFKEQFSDWNPTKMKSAISWLVENKMLIRAGLVHGMQTYQVPPE